MTGTISRTPCPQCKEVGGLFISSQVVAQPIGEWSLSGGQMKTPVSIKPFLKCANCALSIAGEFDGEHHATFVPSSQHAKDASTAR